MSLLPLSPFLAAALVCVALGTPSGAPADAAEVHVAASVRRIAADTSWQQLLLVGPGPVFRHADPPMRG